MKLFIFAALVLGLVALGEPAVAAKPAPSGTIAIAAGSDLRLGGAVSFDYTVDNLPGNAGPRIQVQCFQDTDADGQVDDIVYGEAWGAGVPFLLGSGSSPWKTNGGPAHCVATLYYWDFHPVMNMVVLDVVEFDAGG